MPKAEKELMLDELNGFLKDAETVFMAECSGVDSNEMNLFRKSLKKEGAGCMVFKNTLLSRAFSGGGWEDMQGSVSGPTMLISAPDNPVKVAKVLSGFADSHKGVSLKAGFLERSFVTGGEISEISKLPPREELLSKLLGGFMSPVARFVNVINAPVGAFVRVLNAIGKQTGGDNDGREGN